MYEALRLRRVVQPQQVRAWLKAVFFVQDTLIMAAGGVQPQQVRAWLKAGADVVALGTQVLGLLALLVLVQKYTH